MASGASETSGVTIPSFSVIKPAIYQHFSLNQR
jgi:hypothetical protein